MSQESDWTWIREAKRGNPYFEDLAKRHLAAVGEVEKVLNELRKRAAIWDDVEENVVWSLREVEFKKRLKD